MDQFDVNLDRNTRKKLNFGKVCPKFSKGEDCDECARSDALYKASRAADNQVDKEKYLNDARTLYAKSKIFINAINVKDEDKSYPVRVYALPPSVYDDLMGQIRGLRQLDTEANVFHPITGRNILVTKKGSSIQTRYTVQIDNKPTELPNEKVLDSLKAGDVSCLPNLDEVETFIDQNYLHITQFENNGNIIRLLPPFNGHTVYKELKFHRFTVESLSRGFGQEQQEETAIPDAPEIGAGGTSDEFDPFALPQTETTGEGASDPTDVKNPVPDPNADVPMFDGGTAQQDDLPFGESSGPNLEDIQKQVSEISTEA